MSLSLLGLGSLSFAADGEQGRAILARKILIAARPGPSVLDNGVILISGARIEAVGLRGEVDIPEGYEVLDVGDNWVSPGFLDLHNHTASDLRSLNDTVYLTNPGLRAWAGAIPDNAAMRVALAAGVTSVLTIPGSGSNMGGQGVLQRTGFRGFEANLIRNPGSLKLAQAGNPERSQPWTPRRSFMNYNTRSTFRRGVAYAKRWEAFEAGTGEKPARDLQFDIFRSLYKGEAQVSTHTQIYQVVLMTVTMVSLEFGLPVFIDHGTFDGFRAAPQAQAAGVNAILGPRAIQAPRPGSLDTDGAILGVAASYQERGHTTIGFNTDAPVIPQEELPLQAAMGVRYGFDDSKMDALRGLTIVPAMTVGLHADQGSVEVGKYADLIVTTGNPIDPRSSVELVIQHGQTVYDTSKERRRW
jgi:imidazolonepropionase-like amidohydrolase